MTEPPLAHTPCAARSVGTGPDAGNVCHPCANHRRDWRIDPGRTARGHTGRPLIADGFELAAFLLVQAAVVVRVFGGLAWPGLTIASAQQSAILWAVAFGLYAVRYWPILTKARLDGKPG